MTQVTEWLDVVNEHDEVVGTVTREDAYARSLTVRVVNAFLINQSGQLWIPRRTAHKRLFPDCLDMSVGGHVEHGETYEQAFRRETQEELNLNVDDLPWQQIATLGPRDGLSAFMHVYELRRDDPPTFNPGRLQQRAVAHTHRTHPAHRTGRPRQGRPETPCAAVLRGV